MMEIRKFAASVRIPSLARVPSWVEPGIPDFVTDITIEEAKLRAPVKFPGRRAAKVEITKIGGPYPIWNPETGELTDYVDWVAHADVYLEDSDDGA